MSSPLHPCLPTLFHHRGLSPTQLCPPPGPLLPSWSSYCPVHQDFYSGLAVAAQDCPASAFSHVNSDTIRALVGKPRVRYLWGELGGGDSDAG